jgi:dephospho-CoA kinase
MLTIGLTGGIASGKSQAARYLAELGACVIDADRVAHDAYAPGTAGFDEVVAAFGPDVVGPDGAIDRRRLGARVFADPAELARLTAIVWPHTRRLLEARIAEQRALGTAVVVLEAAVLFDAGWQDLVDEVWLVESSREAVLERLRDRGVKGADAERRLAAATDVARARRLATRVIPNDATLEDLRHRVEEAWSQATGSRSETPSPSPQEGEGAGG